MKQAKNIGLSLLGFVLIGARIYMIRTVSDPQGIMRALPFLLVGFGCGIFGHGWVTCWQKRQCNPIRQWRGSWRSPRPMSAT